MKIYSVAAATMPVPEGYGSFHLSFFVCVILLTVLLCALFKDASEKTVKKITLSLWDIMLLFEIYKQAIFGLSVNDGVFSFDYAWYTFPFQFCSTPLYILPIIAFSKKARVRDCCLAYMMTYSLFAGLFVLCYPGDVFIDIVGINFQTMIHHGLQIVIGVLYAVRYRERLKPGFFLGGTLVFAAMVLIAVVLNEIFYRALSALGICDTFNMFYISPYFTETVPVLGRVYPDIPYALLVGGYFLGFVLLGFLTFSAVSRLAKCAKNE